jgi:integrase
MAKARLRLVAPATEKRTVTPIRRPNAELRPREHLTEREVNKLIETAKGNRWGQRDSTIILIAFRHGLRASELCELQWSDVKFESGTLLLRRAKGGATATHPLLGDELRALRALKREAKSPFIFVSERGAPFSVAGLFQGLALGLGVPIRGDHNNRDIGASGLCPGQQLQTRHSRHVNVG